MPWALRTRGIGQASPLDLTEAEFDQIRESFERLMLAQRLCFKFAMILDNYKELEAECFQISLDRITSGPPTIPAFQGYRQRFERRLLNLFSTTLAYEEFLKISGPNQDAGFLDGGGLLEATMDQDIGRAMKSLRNYVQHADLPLKQCSGTRNEAGQIVHSYVPTIDPDKIDFHRVRRRTQDGMRIFVDGQRKNRSLLQLVREFVDLFGGLNWAIQKATHVDLEDACKVLRNFESRFATVRNIDLSVSLCAVEYEEKDRKEIKVVPILKSEFIDGIRKMRDLYARDLHLSRQFISSEAEPK